MFVKIHCRVDVYLHYANSFYLSKLLNWDTIVSKKGENRIDHINRHAVPNMNREIKYIFVVISVRRSGICRLMLCVLKMVLEVNMENQLYEQLK